MVNVTRQVMKVDADAQGELFGERWVEPLRQKPLTRGRVTFHDPDPQHLVFGGGSLAQHLRDAGEHAPFVVRELLEGYDWSEFEAAYRPLGRRPYHPRVMVGVVLFGLTRGVSSLRELERLARIDLACMWVSGGLCPDHSSLCRFINLHSALLTGDFFESLTRKVLELTGSDVSSVAGDGTVIQAAASRYGSMKKEAAEAERRRAREAADRNPDDDKAGERAKRAETALATLEERTAKRKAKGKDPETTSVSRTDPDSMTQKMKNGAVAPSYKASVIANEKRVIVACAVDASSEINVVAGMLETTERVGGQCPEQAMFDAGYHADAIIDLAIDKGIDLLVPEGQTNKDGTDIASKPGKKFSKSDFEYDAGANVYRCPAGNVLKPRNSRGHKGQSPKNVEYTTDACGNCPMRAQCTKRADGRKITRCAGDEGKEALREVMSQPRARERYKKRLGMVEPVYADLRARQGLNRFRRFGLAAVRLELVLHAAAHNLRRAIAAAAAAVFCRYLWLLWRLLRGLGTMTPHGPLCNRAPALTRHPGLCLAGWEMWDGLFC